MPHEVAILGGGVAGAATAIHLARLRYSVTLFEREKEPHPKMCGEFLSPETVKLLEEIPIALDNCGATSYKYFKLHSPHCTLETHFPFSTRGLSRTHLDSLLLREAEKAGATVLRGAKVSHFEWTPSSQTFLIKTDTQTTQFQTLFLATGKHPLKDLHPRAGLESKNIGYKMVFQLSKKNTERLSETLEIFSFSQGYAGLSLIEDQQANLCFVVQQSLVQKTGGAFKNILEHLKSHHKRLAGYLQDSIPLWKNPLVISGIPYGFLESEKQEAPFYCVGDQLAVIPSFTGTGIAIALWSAKKATLAFHQRQAPAQYHASCKAELQSQMTLSYRLHRLLQNSWIADLGVYLLKSSPTLLQTLFQKTRMPL
jgi:flavin-dependent dehydrogenase